MKEVIPPVEKKLILSELTKDKFLRNTNNANNELYIVDHHNSPNIVKEIGRLREITFREAGGGTGKDCDLDVFDTAELPYQQLIVWDPSEEEILGGYRFIIGNDIVKNGKGIEALATSKLFNFSDEFIKTYLPQTVELGRSFVQPAYQSTQRGKKSLYALDNLWDGLGALWVNNQDHKFFFGKVTMYTSFNPEARNMILYFMNKHFGDRELVSPISPLDTNIDEEACAKVLVEDDVKKDLRILSQEVRARGEVIPPLINAYINLSKSLKCFGTVMNHAFGEVEETAIMISVDDMYESKTERHIQSYLKELEGRKVL